MISHAGHQHQSHVKSKLTYNDNPRESETKDSRNDLLSVSMLFRWQLN